MHKSFIDADSTSSHIFKLDKWILRIIQGYSQFWMAIVLTSPLILIGE
jgi:hypothetical protein